MVTYSEKIKTFLDFLHNIETEYNIALSLENDSNNETQDLLHQLELNQLEYHDYARVSKALQQVRKERRDAKDVEMRADPIVKWVQENGKVVKSLERLLGDVRKAENMTQNRHYIEKTDIVAKTLVPREKKTRKSKKKKEEGMSGETEKQVAEVVTTNKE